MIRPTSKTALVTHKGCLDGTGSALVFIWAGGRRDRIIFKNPSMLVLSDEDVPSDVTDIWYADCCPPTMGDPAAGRPFLVFDHHVSNERAFGDDGRCTFDMGRSGSSLMAHVLGQIDSSDSFEMEGRRELIKALESYDLGRFDYEPGQRLSDVAVTYSQEQMLDLMIERGSYGTLYDRDLTCRAEAMASVRNLYADSAAHSALYSHINVPSSPGIEHTLQDTCGRIRIGMSSSPVYWKNEVSERILDSGKADMAVIIDLTGGMVSLRSRPSGPDCSIIADLYGGGGHACAAGFKIKSSDRVLELLSNEVFK